MLLPAGDKAEVDCLVCRSICSCLPLTSMRRTVWYVGAYALYNKLQTQSSATEDGRNYSPKHVELIEITNNLLLLHLVGCLYHCSWAFFLVVRKRQ